MKLILLFTTIIIGVNGHLVDESKLCQTFLDKFSFDYMTELNQGKCCKFSKHIKVIQEYQPYFCRTLLTNPIEQLEDVLKMTCERDRFEYGCPYNYFHIFAFLYPVFLWIMTLTNMVIQFGGQALRDLGGRPLMIILKTIESIGRIAVLTFAIAVVYYHHLWYGW